ncbi:MAG: HAD family hydrolase [Acidobacteria bacterium]|nr:MAG: HAD family hydrolase [Acidobacteriota bacterium]
MDTLVFDLDGVLVDVSASFRTCIGRTLEALGGRPAADAEIVSLKLAGGFNNDWDVTRELLRQQGIAVARERVVEVFSQIYRGAPGEGVFGPEGLIHRESWLLPPAQLAQLAEHYRLAIFTGRPRRDAEFTLRHCGAAGAFAEMVALEDAPAKPDPEGLRRLGARLYIGDTVDDARCAAAAGVAFIGICLPASDLERRFRELGAQFTAAAVCDVINGLGRGEADQREARGAAPRKGGASRTV